MPQINNERSSGINDWWKNEPRERFWLEVTDRPDIGINLKAPQTNEHGKEFWSYSLLKFVRSGDVIFHYSRKKQAFISRSVATGNIWEDKIVWAARGALTREERIQPHIRPGYYLGLEQYQLLGRILDLKTIRDFQKEVVSKYKELVTQIEGPVYFPFEIGDLKRPIRPMQGYLFKLPTFFVDFFSSSLIDSPITIKETQSENSLINILGEEYKAADEETTVGLIDPFSIDPSLVERALRGHAITQNGLAEFLIGINITPRSPKSTEPNFDLAWTKNEEIWVAEIKSITNSNEEKQLRLGLGQVLRYCQLLRSKGTVRGALVTEKALTDISWEKLCDDCNILLIWPENWEKKLVTQFNKHFVDDKHLNSITQLT